jgi:hypothetical protein
MAAPADRISVEVVAAGGIEHNGVHVALGLLVYVTRDEFKALGDAVKLHELAEPADDMPGHLSIIETQVEPTLPREKVTRRTINMVMDGTPQEANDPRRKQALIEMQEFFEAASARGMFREWLRQLPMLEGTPEQVQARAALNRCSGIYAEHARRDGSIASARAALEIEKALLEFQVARDNGFARQATRRVSGEQECVRASRALGNRTANAVRSEDARARSVAMNAEAVELERDGHPRHAINRILAKRHGVSPTRIRQIRGPRSKA